ncbi:MAG: tail fiber domain-containing protein [Planctomycetes bacterium]|nr:tail fiber domain-containing protein [Planctomycetota bacterium]
MKRFLTLFFAMLVIFVGMGISFATPPQTINFQGKLYNSSGTEIDSTVSMTFKIYDVATGGTALWTETQNVTVTDGVYSVILGSSTVITLAFDTQYYLGIKVGADSEMTPRYQLASVPYTFRASVTDSVDWTAITNKPAGFADDTDDEGNVGGTGSITGDMILDETLSGNDFPDEISITKLVANDKVFYIENTDTSAGYNTIALKGLAKGSNGTGVMGVNTADGSSPTDCSGIEGSATNYGTGVIGKGAIGGYFKATQTSSEYGVVIDSYNASSSNPGLKVNGNIVYTGTITDISDERLKENIKPITNALEKLLGINGVYYNLKDSTIKQIGVLAQDVQKTLPESVSLVGDKDYLGVDYTSLVPVLIEAMKELKLENDKLKERIELLEKK